jgi:hypothetical protein
MRLAPRLLVLAACVALASGCARVATMSTVKADGSWTRIVKLRVPAADPMQPGPTPKLEDVFVLPTGGPWKVKRATVESEVVYTAERTVAKGETLKNDIVIKGGNKAPMGRLVVNEVTVKEIAPGKLEYREVLRWQGERPKEVLNPDAATLASIKGALPKALATDANARDLGKILGKEFWRMLMGPGEPLFTQLLTHPDLAERQMQRRMGGVVNTALQQKFGDMLPAEERLATTRKLVSAIIASSDTTSKAKTKAEPNPMGGGDSAMVALAFTLKPPGKVVSTNGDWDEVMGEVFWALYSEAAAPEDLVLTATCEVGK